MTATKRIRVSWEVEVRSKDGGTVLGSFEREHERKRDAITEAERIRDWWAEHEWKCTTHVVRVERKDVA